MNKLIKPLFLILALSVFASCKEDTSIDLSQISKEARFIRFDSAFFNSDTSNITGEIERLSALYPEFYVAGKNPVFWKSQRNSEQQLELFASANKVFNDFSSINENLNFSMKHFYYYFPEVPETKFYSYISNLDFEYPILYTPEQNICFAGIDLYLGPNKPFYQSLPAYQAYFRQPAFLVRDCIDAVCKPHIARKVDAATLLDDMIYYGKQLYFLEKMLPQKEETIIAQYTPEHLDFCKKNERTIWAYFVENKHLFDTSQDLKRRFTELAPFSKFRMQFDAETPGMIGRWVGWQIVRTYMAENESVTLQQLGQETDSRKILKLSGYRP